MNQDLIAFEHFPGDQSFARRSRVKAQKVLYYLVTGYWNTGERLHPLFVTNNYVNHLRVYQYISQFTAGKQVLDVGCGVGYGTALLGRTAARCVGIDISQTAVNEAFRLYPFGEFLKMDAENMTFPAESFDVIVSTENFEHLPDQAKHVRELARVVRKDGFCFVATPNPELFVGQNNPFHTKENTYAELRDLLSKCFREVEIVEPTRVPANAAGRAAREERFARGEHGTLVTPDMEIFGRKVDQTFLSNTHSFHCFARGAIG
ncbi:MAG: class I SAM-dependent methyltransferase [Acidobacteriaceae bacterium]